MQTSNEFILNPLDNIHGSVQVNLSDWFLETTITADIFLYIY